MWAAKVEINEVWPAVRCDVGFHLVLLHPSDEELRALRIVIWDTFRGEKEEGVAFVAPESCGVARPRNIGAPAKDLSVLALDDHGRLLTIAEAVEELDESKGWLWLTGIASHQKSLESHTHRFQDIMKHFAPESNIIEDRASVQALELLDFRMGVFDQYMTSLDPGGGTAYALESMAVDVPESDHSASFVKLVRLVGEAEDHHGQLGVVLVVGNAPGSSHSGELVGLETLDSHYLLVVLQVLVTLNSIFEGVVGVETQRLKGLYVGEREMRALHGV